MHSRNSEWSFILKYLPDISMFSNAKALRVLDVGCNESDLISEIDNRGYASFGIDCRVYFKPLPKEIHFLKGDITDPKITEVFGVQSFFYIVALSSIEHIGLGAYGEKKDENGDRLALENIHKMLYNEGYFLITIPLEYWGSDSGRGYTPSRFNKLIEGLFKVYEITHNQGQICAVLVKI